MHTMGICLKNILPPHIIHVILFKKVEKLVVLHVSLKKYERQQKVPSFPLHCSSLLRSDILMEIKKP
jgi:hypothetical protein